MKQITEKDNEQELWYKEAHEQTLETLPEFIRHLLEDYGHDYGTICHALAAGAVATSSAMDRSPQGGITGFQAGAIMWEFMGNWNNVKPPAKLIRYENMLYPQYRSDFTTISKDTWKWLQEEAPKRLLQFGVHPAVERHWTDIANGIVPFGYGVKE